MVTQGPSDASEGEKRPPKGAPEDLAATLAGLAEAGFEEAEVYLKKGRSRRLEHGPTTHLTGFHQERGWAVRAGGDRASCFACGSGSPPPGGPWPEPDGFGLRLPEPDAGAEGWSEPPDFDAPLIGETEGLRLLAAFEPALAEEMPEARLMRAVLEDGSSESWVASSRGIRASYRRRLASLRLEGAVSGDGGRVHTASLYLAEREARRLNPKALARRLADLLAIRLHGRPAVRDRGDLLLAPAVGSALLNGLRPFLVGAEKGSRLAGLRDGRGRVGSEALTILDDGRLAGGLLAAPADGEGRATGRVRLIDEGHWRQPLLPWDQVRTDGGRATGCVRRASWRDLPAAGPTHLLIQPDPSVAVSALLAGIARGYYLVDAPGSGRFETDGSRFQLPVCGFAVQGGQTAPQPIRGAVLTGSVGALLQGVKAVARDLTFAPYDGMIGSPTLLVAGLELANC
ncbi:MAG: metallopeptidase TldD-related protein [Acidobacteriota bacterium]